MEKETLIGGRNAVDAIAEVAYAASCKWEEITQGVKYPEWKDASPETQGRVVAGVIHAIEQNTNKPWVIHDAMVEHQRSEGPQIDLKKFEELTEESRTGFAIMVHIVYAVNQYLLLKPDNR